MVAIILEPLAQDVTLERRYSAKLGKYAGSIKAEHIGISSPKTWHGSPDAWVKGAMFFSDPKMEKTKGPTLTRSQMSQLAPWR